MSCLLRVWIWGCTQSLWVFIIMRKTEIIAHLYESANRFIHYINIKHNSGPGLKHLLICEHSDPWAHELNVPTHSEEDGEGCIKKNVLKFGRLFIFVFPFLCLSRLKINCSFEDLPKKSNFHERKSNKIVESNKTAVGRWEQKSNILAVYSISSRGLHTRPSTW